MGDKEWIQLAKKGDSHAFAVLFQEHYSFLVKYLIKITMNPDIAEELAQETMAKCIEKIHLYNEKSKFSSWLITIATNLYIDIKRKKKRENQWITNEHVFRKIKWQLEQQNVEWNDALTALNKLPETVRVLIVLKHYYGYSYDEISKMFHMKVGTVKSRIHYGLDLVRKELEGNDSKKPR